MLLFRRCAPTTARFSCIALTSMNHIRLVDFPPEDMETMQVYLTKNYMPGLRAGDRVNGKAILEGYP